MSIHCNANENDIEKIVLMPGDPNRAKYIADNFLENVKIVNTVRNMTAFTGEYKGKKVTVFPSGMGMPSMGIYCYELYKFYNVEKIIRIGSCGAYDKDLDLFDTLLVTNSYTEGNFAKTFDNRDINLVSASTNLNEKIYLASLELLKPVIKGTVMCSECFDAYMDNVDTFMTRFPKELNIIGSEMEAFALFYIANYLKKEAACLLTVVDTIHSKKESTSEQRETSLNDMITIALESIKDY